MPLHDLSKVTTTLMALLKANIKAVAGLEITVTPQPPEQVGAEVNKLNLYLYHVAEDDYYKNAPGPGNDVPNVAKAPMALNLHYLLTVHHVTGSDSELDALTEQRLMGLALKTFHDYPVITDRTQVAGTAIVDPNDPDLHGRENTLQVILRSVSPEDSIAFWSAEEKRTTRLSAYYEVRVVMLEPEEAKTLPGIVLNIGAFVVPIGAPYLDSSRSLVRFKLPERNGGIVPPPIEASPARVTLDSSANPPEAHNRLLLLGSNLTIGKSQSLFLKNAIWAGRSPPDGPVEQTVVGLAQNPDWAVEFRTDRVLVELSKTLTHVKADGMPIALPMLPGFYSAFVQTLKDEQVINNELKRIVVTSNEVGFAVSPLIIGHDAPNADDTIQVNLDPAFDPLDADLPEGAIQVVVAGEVYTATDDDPPTAAKQFFVSKNPSNLIRIKPHFPVAVTEPMAHPFRLIVNRAEAAPFWIELSP